MGAKETPEQEQIRVEDRRHFDREGNPITEADGESEKTNSAAASAEGWSGPGPSHSPERVSFVSILFSYVHSALIFLGDMEDPIKKGVSENLESGRQMIDILEVLEHKTKGNLTADEEKYLQGALFDLRMRYMQKAKLIK